MQKIKKRGSIGRIYSDKKARKKHVESMFLTNKKRNYPFYFKDKMLWTKSENNFFKFFSPRHFYTIRITESGYINLKPLKAIVRMYKWFLKEHSIEDGLRMRLRIFPDFVLTSKPKEMRMGKGKGMLAEKVAVVKSGTVLLTLENKGVSYFLVKLLIKYLSWKVPLRHLIELNNW